MPIPRLPMQRAPRAPTASRRPPELGTAEVTVGIPTFNRSGSLRGSIASVLAQSYRNFTLVVSDNASDDDTTSVVASFADPRLVYRRLERNIGRLANFNRIVELAETEFVLLLGDDDELHPDHLTHTVEALKRWPTAGVAHTGCEVAGMNGKTDTRFVQTRRSPMLESGADFLERSMRSGWTLCFSSALLRKAAFESGGGLRPEDGVIDDLPLWMRIATGWDFAYVNRPLATMSLHAESSSSSLGTVTADGFRSSRALPDMLYEHRRSFLAAADIPEQASKRLARIARKAYRRDRLSHLSGRARMGEGMGVTFDALAREVRDDPRLGLDPLTWRFVVGQLGGRRIGDRLRGAAEPLRRRR